MNDLFRTQAVEHRKHRLHGDVLLIPRISHTSLLGLLLTWAIMTLWLLNTFYRAKKPLLIRSSLQFSIVRLYSEDRIRKNACILLSFPS